MNPSLADLPKDSSISSDDSEVPLSQTGSNVISFESLMAFYDETEMVKDYVTGFPSENIFLLEEWIKNYRISKSGKVAIQMKDGDHVNAICILESNGTSDYAITMYRPQYILG